MKLTRVTDWYWTDLNHLYVVGEFIHEFLITDKCQYTGIEMNTHAFLGSFGRMILFDFTAGAEELPFNIACLVPSFNNRTV